MKKIFTLFTILMTISAFAGTPTINGVYSASEGWGPIRGTGTQVGAANGWQGTDAMELYVTADANYYYFGAKCKAANWMQFIFVVNTKAGGDSTDPWGRTIKYKQTNLPDYLFRGDLTGTNYAQFQGWNGTSWDKWNGTAYQAMDVNANASLNEVKGSFNVNDSGFIEIRVPKAAISGNPLTGDIQFIIGGNTGGAANGHGIFDAIPNESNGTSWSAPGNATIATSYVSMVPLPIKLNSFNGSLVNSKVNLNWQTGSESNLDGFEIEKQQGNAWNKIGFVAALNNANGSNYSFSDASLAATNIYRIKSISLSGNIVYSQIVVIRASKSTGTQVFPTFINSNTINIRTLEDKEGKATIKVVDMQGKIIQQTSVTISAGDVTQTFALNNLQTGMYLVEVNTVSNKTVTKIMVK